MDFVGIGPQRTASSWLHRMLAQHPELSLPVTTKETFFFNRYFDRGPEWYARQFDPLRSACLRGEIGPSYFDSPLAIQRLARVPDLKVIASLRNPIARAFSLFRHHRSRGRVPAGFFQAVERMPVLLSSGLYARWLPQWEQQFGRSRMLCVVDDDIASDPQSVLDALCRFLGVGSSPMPAGAWHRVNRSTEPPAPAVAHVASALAIRMRSRGLHRTVERIKRMGGVRIYGRAESSATRIDEEVFEFLLHYHEPDIEFIETLTGRRFDHWRRTDASP